MDTQLAAVSPLDARLAAAYEMTPACDLCADIGADHGKLSAALLMGGKVQRMLVADISDKALDKARKHLRFLGMAEKAVFAVADGLKALEAAEGQRTGAVLILGMGGDTMAHILTEGQAALRGATLILGPQTDIPFVRETVSNIGYRFREERAVQVSNRFYVILKATPALEGERPYTEEEWLLGPCLMQSRPEAWLAMLARRKRLLIQAAEAMAAAGSSKDSQRLEQTRQELFYVEKALAGRA